MPTTRSVAVWLALTACAPAALVAQPTGAGSQALATLLARPLTADTAVQIALLHEPQLEAERLGVEAARARRAQAAALPNPELKLDFRGSGDSPLQSDIELELDLLRALQTPARTGIADARVEAAQREAQVAAATLAHRVRTAFFDVQATEHAWRLAVRELETYVAARDAARALHAAGNATALALAQHEAASEAARVAVADAELSHHEAREHLQRLMGLHGSLTEWQVEPWSAAAPANRPSLPDLEARAVEASLELARMRAERDALAREARLERATGWLPELSVDLHAERDDARWDLGGGVRVAVPLFDRRHGRVNALRAELRALESRYRAAVVALRSHARDARNRAVAAAARARHWNELALPAARRVVAETLLQHNAMQVSVFALLEAKRAELAAERAASEAGFAALRASAALDAVLAGVAAEPAPLIASSRAIAPNSSTGGH
jgi:outer membrane protein TolC